MVRTGDKDIKLKIDKDSRISVLMGGVSSERGISFKSGAAVYNALKKFYKNTFTLDIQTDDKREVKKILEANRIDVAFIALHGRFGEDGGIQAILEAVSIPYTGSGPKSSKMAMDKHKSKLIFEKFNIPFAQYKILYKKDCDLKRLDDFPYIVKPARGGSSIGMTIVRKKEQLQRALELAFRYDSKVIIERYIQGRELTVGILEDRPLDIIEIVPKSRFFDFKAKYKGQGTEYIIPAVLPRQVSNNIKEIALLSHSSLGCKSFSRVDIMLDIYYNPFILEVNTIPGLTDKSLLPKAAKKKGVEFDELCIKLLNSSLR